MKYIDSMNDIHYRAVLVYDDKLDVWKHIPMECFTRTRIYSREFSSTYPVIKRNGFREFSSRGSFSTYEECKEYCINEINTIIKTTEIEINNLSNYLTKLKILIEDIDGE